MATQKGRLNMPNGDIMHLETDADVTLIQDAGGYFTSNNTEGALQELGARGSSSVGVTDTTSVNLTLTDGTITADVIFGTTTGVAVAGDDSRLSDSRTPLAHNQASSTITDFATAALTAAPAETTTTIGTLINGATAKTTPVDADLFAMSDSAASYITKKVTLANLKTVLGGVLAPASHVHAESEITNLTTDLAAKQATLVSGTNIKTINSASVLGSGDITLLPLSGGTLTGVLNTQGSLTLATEQISMGSLVKVYVNATGSIFITSNCYHNGTNWIYTTAAAASIFALANATTVASIYYAAAGTAGATISAWTTSGMVYNAGNVTLSTSAPAGTLAEGEQWQVY